MDIIEPTVRWAGAAATAALLAAVLWGLWRGRGRPRGRGTGPGQRISSLPFPVYLLMTAGFVGLCVLLWRPIPLELSITARIAALAVGALLLFPGVALTLWARFALGTMYGVSGSVGAQLYAGHRLITSGPYAIVRHPMYLGIMVAALGALAVYRTWTTVYLVLSALGFAVRARREEGILAAEFGEEWQAYCRRVPGWVPHLPRPGGPKDAKSSIVNRKS